MFKQLQISPEKAIAPGVPFLKSILAPFILVVAWDQNMWVGGKSKIYLTVDARFPPIKSRIQFQTIRPNLNKT